MFKPRPRPDPQPIWTADEMAILRGEQDRPTQRTLDQAAWRLATRYPSLTMDQCKSAVRLAAELLEQQQAGRPPRTLIAPPSRNRTGAP